MTAITSMPLKTVLLHVNAMQPKCSSIPPNLLVVLILSIISSSILLGSSSSLLAANTARTSTTEGRAQSEVDVLLRVETDNERWDVDDLLANTDVSLADQNTSVMDRLGEAELVDTGL